MHCGHHPVRLLVLLEGKPMLGLPLHFGSHLPPVVTEHKNVVGLNGGVMQKVKYTLDVKELV